MGEGWYCAELTSNSDGARSRGRASQEPRSHRNAQGQRQGVQQAQGAVRCRASTGPPRTGPGRQVQQHGVRFRSLSTVQHPEPCSSAHAPAVQRCLWRRCGRWTHSPLEQPGRDQLGATTSTTAPRRFERGEHQPDPRLQHYYSSVHTGRRELPTREYGRWWIDRECSDQPSFATSSSDADGQLARANEHSQGKLGGLQQACDGLHQGIRSWPARTCENSSGEERRVSPWLELPSIC